MSGAGDMSALDLLKAHFDSLGRKEYREPLTGLVIYFSPVTAREQQLIKTRAKGSEAAMAAHLVALKSQKSDGSAAFGDDPNTIKALLTEISAEALANMAGAIMGVDDEAAGDSLGE